VARRSDDRPVVEKEEAEFDELQAMRRIDNLLKKAPDDNTRKRITRWLFAKWGEQEKPT
jgi:hypothetical protein